MVNAEKTCDATTKVCGLGHVELLDFGDRRMVCA
jgi:hypothetical protein